MFVYSAVHIYLTISLADFWLFALLARTISPGFDNNLVSSAFSSEYMGGGQLQQTAMLDAGKTPGTRLGLFFDFACLNDLESLI